MLRLAAAIKEVIEEYVQARMACDPNTQIRLVLVGPPREALGVVFNLLTNNGTCEWHISVGGQEHDITVLWIDAEASTTSSILKSQRCDWDYAVNVRNSVRQAVLLVSPAKLDAMQESITNATDIIGTPRLDTAAAGWWTIQPWAHIVQKISENLGAARQVIRDTLNSVIKASVDLEPVARGSYPWSVADQLLEPLTTLSPSTVLAATTGLPFFEEPTITPELLRSGIDVIRGLGEFLEEQGLNDGISTLKGTETAQNDSLGGALDELSTHLLKRAGSGLAFSRIPTWFYRPGSTSDSWWRTLTEERLGKMLEEAGYKKSPKKKSLALTCENPKDGKKNPVPDPCIVVDHVELKAGHPQEAPPPTITFRRKVGRTWEDLSASNQGDTCIDDGITADGQLAEKPIRYECSADDYKPGKVDVVILDRFTCRGIARVREARRNNAPSKPKKQPNWRQEIEVSRAGIHDLDIYHASDVATVEIWHESKLLESKPANSPARFILQDVEHNYQLQVVLKANNGNELSKWTIEFSVTEEDIRKAPTRFDALVQAHQERKRQPGIVQPRNVPLRQIESSYLASQSSWRPVLACWESEVEKFPIIHWEAPRLGTITPQPDPRPKDFAPPSALIEARDEIRVQLYNESRQLVEIDLAKPGLSPLIEVYLKEYVSWLSSSPNQATWFDCIAIHVTEQNIQAGRVTASSEPYVILLSPFHPLRLGWQYLAQSQLAGSLPNHCPAAGLLSPHGCPNIGSWPLYAGTGYESWRTFFTISSDNPYWAVLLNQQCLEHDKQRQVLQILVELGLEPRGLVGRFTESQAEDTLNEVSKILSARSVLRMGIVGSGEATSECIEGIIRWCDLQFSEESEKRSDPDKAPLLPPYSVEIFYQEPIQGKPDHWHGISSERIAALSEKTGEKVRWFVHAAEARSRDYDLVILDQLGVYDARGKEGEARSPISNGVLYRSRVREDSEGALWLAEARVAKPRETLPSISGTLERAIILFEEGATRDNNTTQLRFRPNQQAIGERLGRSRFVAVTSSQVDPACFSRSVEAQNGFLWDYDVPGALGIEEKSAGYYLVTRASDAMRIAIAKAASLVTDQDLSDTDLLVLLNEISRRGIPILKRMAAGGSASRGEMGMLLAVRLLQDAFRDISANLHLPVCKNNCLHLILPVDPYEAPLNKLGQAVNRSASIRYADLLVFAIYLPTDPAAPLHLKITPLEVKFREGKMSPKELGEALEQAASLGNVLTKLWSVPLYSEELWETCSTALLAQFVEYAFRIYADERVHKLTTAAWTQRQEQVLQSILCRNAQVQVISPGRLIVFDGSDYNETLDMDNDGSYDTAIICRTDAEVLLLGQDNLSQSAEQAVTDLGFSLPLCHEIAATIAPSEPAAIAITIPTVAESLTELTTEGSQSPAELDLLQVRSVEGLAGGFLDEEMEDSEESQDIRLGDNRQIIPPEIRQQVDLAFEGFIGNQRAVNTLKRSLLKALVEKPPYLDKNFLLIGPPSTGKTDLSKRMAAALGLPFVHVDGRMVRTREKLFELIDAALAEKHQSPQRKGTKSGLPVYDYPPFVIFVDEVHLVPKKTQEALLTLLEKSDRTVILEGQGRRVAQVTRTTFLFATTRPSELDKPFRTRCLDVPLQRYSRTEVAEIVHRFEPLWSRDVLLKIATYSRLVPRRALAFAQELKDEMLVSLEISLPVEKHLEKVARSMGIDEQGLTDLDVQYLDVLERAKRPLGESAILSMLGAVDKDAILDEVEPYLAYQLEFIRMERQGRIITEKGISFLLERRRKGKNLGNSKQ